MKSEVYEVVARFPQRSVPRTAVNGGKCKYVCLGATKSESVEMAGDVEVNGIDILHWTIVGIVMVRTVGYEQRA